MNRPLRLVIQQDDGHQLAAWPFDQGELQRLAMGSNQPPERAAVMAIEILIACQPLLRDELTPTPQLPRTGPNSRLCCGMPSGFHRRAR